MRIGVKMTKPKTPAERMAKMRANKKLTEAERLAQRLAKTIKLQLFHGTNETLDRLLIETGITEPEDLITRLIHGSKLLTEEQKKAIFN